MRSRQFKLAKICICLLVSCMAFMHSCFRQTGDEEIGSSGTMVQEQTVDRDNRR